VHEDYDALLPAPLAASRVGVSRQLLNYWRATGLLAPAEKRNGQPLYRLRDVLHAESRARGVPRHGRRSRLITAAT